MTFQVIVKACCSDDREVEIDIRNLDDGSGYTSTLQNGKKWKEAVYDNRSITVRETPKTPVYARYARLRLMNFGEAIEEMKAGHKVWQEAWVSSFPSLYIAIYYPDKDRMTNPYIYIDTTKLETDNEAASKSLVPPPWAASQTDMLAEDWISDRTN